MPTSGSRLPGVDPTGRAIGLVMTPEMLELARANAWRAGVENSEFLEGYLEDLPLSDGSADVVISNCVINLTADKRLVLAEAARALRPGERVAISDVVADPNMDEAISKDMVQWTGRIRPQSMSKPCGRLRRVGARCQRTVKHGRRCCA